MIRERVLTQTTEAAHLSIRTRAFAAAVTTEPTSIKASFDTPEKRERSIYMSMKLYVGNLAFQTSSSDLQQLFGQAGTVESASVIEDRDTGRSRSEERRVGKECRSRWWT